MEKYITKEISDKTIWEKYVLSQDPKTFLHSWNWGETAKILGDKVYRIGFYKGKILFGVALFIKQSAKRGPYLVVPGGPLIDWQNRGLVKAFIFTLKDLSRKENVWFVRMRPEVIDSDKDRLFFKKLNFARAPMHLHAENTWVLDIRKSEAELLSGMRKNTRYLIRKSLTEDLSFEIDNSDRGIRMLFELQKETVQRHKFLGFPEKLFSAQMKTFGADGQMDLYIVKKASKPYVAAMIIYYGNYAYYHHSASSLEATHSEASYFMQWNVIKTAKTKGKTHYNFWGIAPANAKKHRFMGVTIFKRGFGGESVDWIPALDFVISPLYFLTKTIETFRKHFRGL